MMIDFFASQLTLYQCRQTEEYWKVQVQLRKTWPEHNWQLLNYRLN
jgi:beta-galactosidase/beta-glucuronidase